MAGVWLTEWEWACCGEAFAVGDDVDFGIATRTPDPSLAELLGPGLLASVNAVESHHEEEFTDRVRGRVTAVHMVTHDVSERRVLRRPGHGAPPDAVMPPDGQEWPSVRMDLGGVIAGSRPSRYMIEIVPVPGTATLEPGHGVRLPVTLVGAAVRAADIDISDPPVERKRRSLAGWLVDVEDR
ncbi:DUF6578 domain-containing protein [Microbacterium sp. M3]|uniref:DUF6578 domain-containing protein n=1 Tax=Microbacterium arthrosphaerae TaxID=792652 RepID=A0ABU4H571_9MICO|nr:MULTISPECIES: DUF6578 domain-containing protein [Microbacterium]MDW4574498.1 DUF6578 domain-containing protein [Microbacterium arthrosphaerae]MDW7608353.1 DUF6578 domain-containing protein [Microbacterium sp. M3]